MQSRFPYEDSFAGVRGGFLLRQRRKDEQHWETLVEDPNYKNGSVEATRSFVGGTTETVATLAAWITSQTGWRAVVLNSLGSVDAGNVLRVPSGPCLGTSSTYASDGVVTASASARTLGAVTTVTNTLTVAGVSPALSCSDLYVDRIRFGTGGHQVAAPSLGNDVLASDEDLTARLLASDYTNAVGIDYMPATVSYPNTAVILFTATFGVGQGNGLNISEAGLFAPAFMVARKNFSQAAKTSSFEWSAEWSLIF